MGMKRILSGPPAVLFRTVLSNMFWLCLWLSSVALPAAAAEPRQWTCEHFTLGCLFRVIIDDDDNAKAKQAAAEAFVIAEKINDACSEQMADAQVQSFCRKPHGEAHEVGPGFFEALTQARQLAEATDGRFDPTIGPLTRLWRESCRKKSLPDAEAVAKARAPVGWRHLVLDPEKRTALLEKPGASLDFGPIARGFAADKMFGVLVEKGFSRVIVHAGDDIRVGDPPRGEDHWNVRIRLRDGGGTPQLVLPLAKTAVSTAGGMAHAVTIGGMRYARMVDPETGFGLTKFVAATVVADTATSSAALAAACCIGGPDVAAESLVKWGGRAARIVREQDGRRVVMVTEGFPK